MDLELELFGDVKEKTSSNAIGKVYVVSLSSQPVDHEDSTEGRQKVSTVIGILEWKHLLIENLLQLFNLIKLTMII